jgi:hypothetical protein
MKKAHNSRKKTLAVGTVNGEPGTVVEKVLKGSFLKDLFERKKEKEDMEKKRKREKERALENLRNGMNRMNHCGSEAIKCNNRYFCHSLFKVICRNREIFIASRMSSAGLCSVGCKIILLAQNVLVFTKRHLLKYMKTQIPRKRENKPTQLLKI